MTHKKFRLKGRWTPALKALCLLALMSTINLTSFAQAKERSSKALYGPEAAKEIPNATYVKQSPNTRFPSFVRLSPSATIRPTEFFSWLKGTVKASEHTEFTFLTQTTDKFGINHNKYQQTFKGIPVDQSTYVVHVKDGKVSYGDGSNERDYKVVGTDTIEFMKDGKTFATYKFFNGSEALLPSGLMGPVTIRQLQRRPLV